MIINHNISAINAYRQYKINTDNIAKNAAKLASGLRITRASDDASGLAVSEKMRSQIRGLNQASRNAQDGISFIQTADGWLQETQQILQRMRELAVQSANGIYTYEDRMQIQVEIRQLVDEVDRIASQAEFNTLKLLRGGFRREPGDENFNKGIGPRPYTPEEVNKQANPPVRPVDPLEADPSQHNVVRGDAAGDDKGGVYFHIGANMNEREKVYIENMSAYALGLAKGAVNIDAEKREMQLNFLTQDGANKAIGQIDSAIYLVNRQRADMGAYQNRLEHTVRGVDIAAENLQSAESNIRDLDMANEMVDFVKNQILSQTSASMLAQANLRPQVVLRILS
jgi:flagellin